jgi:hypothetical protein
VNIFYIDRDPHQAAKWMVDKHVVKMILESAQLLSTAHRVLDGRMFTGKTATGRNVKRFELPDARNGVIYVATHVNHPSAVWARTAVKNYNWLYEHFHALGQEYTHRYNKIHKCFHGEMAYMLASPPLNLRAYEMTKIPSAMDDQYVISTDPLTNYRNYYKLGKKKLHAYTRRDPPPWLNA